jgi:hypothetical protein
MRGQITARMYKLVGQVFNCMPKNFKCVTGLRVNAAAAK